MNALFKPPSDLGGFCYLDILLMSLRPKHGPKVRRNCFRKLCLQTVHSTPPHYGTNNWASSYSHGERYEIARTVLRRILKVFMHRGE